MFGDTTSGNNSGTLNIHLLPCSVRESLIGASEDRIPAKCNEDLLAAKGYVGPMSIVTYFNEGKFQLDEFGSSSIQKRSVIKQLHADEERPHSYSTVVSKSLLVDQSSYFQLGQSDEADFHTMHFEAPTPSANSAWPTRA